jgi:polyphosphate kinase 2 (PPK2 family)
MFETLEIGRKVKRKEFNKAVLELRQKLLELQFELENKDFPVIIIVSGAEGAGKGSVVHRLNEWMDPRLIETSAFWDHSDEEENRPFSWRFWRALPSHGRIGIFFGSWYTRPILNHATEKSSDTEFTVEMQSIVAGERMFTEDGALIIKLWFHIPPELAAERVRLDRLRELSEVEMPEDDIEFLETYEKLKLVSEQAIRATDTGHSPWHLIEATDPNYRDLTTGQIIEQCLRTRLEQASKSDNNTPPISLVDSENLAWEARKFRVPCVAVFEGWDAAGKGSAIRRVTQAIDPRLFHLIQFAAPTDEEAAHHYLWRFWRQLGRDGKFTIFDRSWYGRVLVERVEGFASDDEWQRAYGEINRFEDQLIDHGTVLLKFWIHISKKEQMERFKLREDTPHKQHKITEEDWRNREKWHDYELAVHDMVTHTSTRAAPWTLVAGNDKRYARIQILRTFCEQLEKGLERAREKADGQATGATT